MFPQEVVSGQGFKAELLVQTASVDPGIIHSVRDGTSALEG